MLEQLVELRKRSRKVRIAMLSAGVALMAFGCLLVATAFFPPGYPFLTALPWVLLAIAAGIVLGLLLIPAMQRRWRQQLAAQVRHNLDDAGLIRIAITEEAGVRLPSLKASGSQQLGERLVTIARKYSTICNEFEVEPYPPGFRQQTLMFVAVGVMLIVLANTAIGNSDVRLIAELGKPLAIGIAFMLFSFLFPLIGLVQAVVAGEIIKLME